MIIAPNTSSSEEQVFIATIEKCLQNDNEKRTAAEVNLHIYINNLEVSLLFFLIRQFIKIYLMKKKLFYLCLHCVT
jgi:hypothetical protein